MPFRHQRSTAGLRAAQRRKLVWASYSGSTDMTANGQKFMVDLLSTYKAVVGADIAGCTVIRTHLRLTPTSTVATNDSFGVGICVIGTNQVTAAETASAMIPDIDNFPYIDWMFNEVQIASSAGYSRMPYAGVNHLDIDNKSKRKLDNIEQTLGLSLINVGVSAPAITVQISARVLLALP